MHYAQRLISRTGTHVDESSLWAASFLFFPGQPFELHEIHEQSPVPTSYDPSCCLIAPAVLRTALNMAHVRTPWAALESSSRLVRSASCVFHGSCEGGRRRNRGCSSLTAAAPRCISGSLYCTTR